MRLVVVHVGRTPHRRGGWRGAHTIMIQNKKDERHVLCMNLDENAFITNVCIIYMDHTNHRVVLDLWGSERSSRDLWEFFSPD